MNIDLKALPTRSWRSHALFRAGIGAAARGDHASAETLYLEALRDDPTNLAARVNFAGELMGDRDDDPANDQFAIELAVEQLQTVLDILEKRRDYDAIYFAALYRLASAYYDLGHAERALKVASVLLRMMDEASNECRRSEAVTDLEKRKNHRVKTFIDQSRPAAEMMYIGMQLEYGTDEGVTLIDLRETAKRASVPTAQFQYNYACALAVYLPRVDRKERTRLDYEVIQRLNLAIRMKEDLRARARIDRALSYLHGNEEFERLVAKREEKTTSPAADADAAG